MQNINYGLFFSEKCVLKSIDDKAKMSKTSLKAGATFSYKEKLSYTCSNKDEDEFDVQCETAGDIYDISCPCKENIIIIKYNEFQNLCF